jgi:kynurenine formamidase
VVIRIEKPCYGTVEPIDLEAAKPRIEPGDIVAIDLGWADTWGTPEWGQHPYLSVDAARWLVDKRAKLASPSTPRRPTCRASGGRRISTGRFTAPCWATGF